MHRTSERNDADFHLGWDFSPSSWGRRTCPIKGFKTFMGRFSKYFMQNLNWGADSVNEREWEGLGTLEERGCRNTLASKANFPYHVMNTTARSQSSIDWSGSREHSSTDLQLQMIQIALHLYLQKSTCVAIQGIVFSGIPCQHNEVCDNYQIECLSYTCVCTCFSITSSCARALAFVWVTEYK